MAMQPGTAVMVIGVLHCFMGAFAIPQVARPLKAIFRAGFFNTVKKHADRGAAAWFQLAGLAWVVIGWLMNLYERDTGSALPAEVGWALLALHAVGAAMMPISGFYLFLWPCFLIIRAN